MNFRLRQAAPDRGSDPARGTSRPSQLLRQPIRDIEQRGKMVVELAVSGPTILAGEDFQLLVLRGDNAEHLLRVVDRDLLVILPVRNKEWAGNELSNRLDLKLLDVLHRRIHGVGAGDVHQLKQPGREGPARGETAGP